MSETRHVILTDAQVTTSGISWVASVPRGEADTVVDVEIDGHRVWSYWIQRDSSDQAGRLVVPWPRALAVRLRGRARVRILEHASRAVAFDADVQFGDDDRPLAIEDQTGHRLALNKAGRIRRVFADSDSATLGGLLDAIEHILAVLGEAGVPAFPTYGTLLGAVRDQEFIGHDDDVDLGYLSACDHPHDAALESFRLERAVRRAGFTTHRHSAFAFKVDIEETDARRGLDVFGALFVGDTLYHMGEVGAMLRRDQVLPLSSCTLAGRRLPAPADPEAWLAAIYGPDWRTPDPAFEFRTARSTTRRLTGWFRGTRRNRLAWDDEYLIGEADDTGDDTLGPSPFARWVLDQAPSRGMVVDLGCGSGRDVLSYARAGHQAVGLDFSRPSSKGAAERAQVERLPASFASVNFIDLRSTLATGTWLAAQQEPATLTAHLTIDALDTGGRDGLWRVCSMAQRRSGTTYLASLEPGAPQPMPVAKSKLLTPHDYAVIAEEVEAHGGRLAPADQRAPGYRWWTVQWNR